MVLNYGQTGARSFGVLLHGPETLKLLQENIGKTLEDISIGNYCLSKTPIAQEITVIIDKRNVSN
jgi:hypothetical protein